MFITLLLLAERMIPSIVYVLASILLTFWFNLLMPDETPNNLFSSLTLLAYQFFT